MNNETNSKSAAKKFGGVKRQNFVTSEFAFFFNCSIIKPHLPNSSQATTNKESRIRSRAI